MKEIKFYNIEYDVSLQDLDNHTQYDSVDDLHNSIPKEVRVEVDDDFFDDEDWKDYGLANELSNATGWCVCSFDYEVIGQTQYNPLTDLELLSEK